jgi:hypothetical protein
VGLFRNVNYVESRRSGDAQPLAVSAEVQEYGMWRGELPTRFLGLGVVSHLRADDQSGPVHFDLDIVIFVWMCRRT